MSEECNVCSEKYNNSTRKLVKCHCGFEFCKNCFKKYILSKKENPSCMNCKIVYTRKFLVENLDKSFISKEYKKLREELLMDQETALMPETQLHIEKLKKISSLEDERLRLIQRIADIDNELYNLRLSIKNKTNGEIERRQFIRNCPNNNCHGFLSTSLKCGLCDNWSCKDCRELIGPDKNSPHECDPEIVKNIESIKKETKPCPKCGVPIYKINGCSSMYCIECDVSFNWNTLRIESGPVHNPEYFEKLRRGAINPPNRQDIVCGRELDQYLIQTLTDKLNFGPYRGIKCKHEYLLEGEEKECCKKIVYRFDVINGGVMRKYDLSYFYSDRISEIGLECIELNTLGVRRLNKLRMNGNKDLRILYLQNKISKEVFMTRVQKRDKKISMNDEIVEIYRVYSECLTDILYRLNSDVNLVQEILDEITILRKRINGFLCDIQKVYNISCKLFVIKEN